MPETAVGDFVGAKVAPSLALARARRAAAQREALADGADFVVGLLVPINGSAGIWGPSSIACAQLAQAEINADGGLLDRRLRLRIIDSSDEATEVGSVRTMACVAMPPRRFLIWTRSCWSPACSSRRRGDGEAWALQPERVKTKLRHFAP